MTNLGPLESESVHEIFCLADWRKHYKIFLRRVFILDFAVFVSSMADGGGAAGAPSLTDIGNLLQQLANEQQMQRSRVEELAQQVAQTQQGVAGAQVVTEQVVGEVVQQVQLAFSQQQQATMDQLTQLAQAVQGQQTGIDQMSQVVSSFGALQQQLQVLAQNVSTMSGSTSVPTAAVGGSPTAQPTAAAAQGSPKTSAGAFPSPLAAVPGQPASASALPLGPQLFNLTGEARVNPAVAYAIQNGAFDQKNLGKPSVYDASKESKQSFHDWQDTMVTFLDASVPGIWEVLEWIANDQPKTALDKEIVKLHFPDVDPLLVDSADSNIYACLSSYTGAEPKALVKQARRPNCFEAWRRLHVRFNPATVGRQRANLTRITNPQGNVPLAQLGAEIISWGNRIIEYEARPGSDVVISENLKIATVVAMCPGKLRERLNLNAHRCKTFQDIREEIFGYLDATYQVANTAMDIGAVTRRKGPCFLCGGERLARDCRKGSQRRRKARRWKGSRRAWQGQVCRTQGCWRRQRQAVSINCRLLYCVPKAYSKQQCWCQKPKSLASIDPQLPAQRLPKQLWRLTSNSRA